MFHFDRSSLERLAREHRDAYRKAKPFPHIVLDDFLPSQVADAVLDEFPRPRDVDWNTYDDPHERKLEGTDLSVMGETTRQLFAELNSAVFVQFLEDLTGIEGLIPDPYLYGGGLHQIEPGGFLKVHADFNWHPKLLLDRRLNLIVYLNKSWEESYGGHLELWNADMTELGDRVLPVFNRCVIFSTTSDANHGHPDPLACPPGQTRKSMALYYYSNGRPAHELQRDHGTAFSPRPGEVWRRPTPSARERAKRLVPPALWDLAKSVNERRAKDT